MTRAWLILPTYNEAENLEPIVRAALPQLRRRRSDRDPRSSTTPRPTGPARSPTGWPPSSTTVEVLHRAAQGGPRAAPTWPASATALDGGAELVVQMDCRLLPRPRRPAAPARRRPTRRRPRARLALRGGRRRRGLGAACGALISRGGCAYARLVLGVPVRDLTGGFKCFRREVLEAIDLDAVARHGYALPDRDDLPRDPAPASGCVEVPIVFRDRRVGQSKMSRAIVARGGLAGARCCGFAACR